MRNNPTPEYGVINEQGFVAGNGLGFNPFDENELNPNQNNLSDKNNDFDSDK